MSYVTESRNQGFCEHRNEEWMVCAMQSISRLKKKIAFSGLCFMERVPVISSFPQCFQTNPEKLSNTVLHLVLLTALLHTIYKHLTILRHALYRPQSTR